MFIEYLLYIALDRGYRGEWIRLKPCSNYVYSVVGKGSWTQTHYL